MKVNIIILILFVIVVIIGVIFFVYKMIDNKKCQIGFEDIEIYAKWEKVIS